LDSGERLLGLHLVTKLAVGDAQIAPGNNHVRIKLCRLGIAFPRALQIAKPGPRRAGQILGIGIARHDSQRMIKGSLGGLEIFGLKCSNAFSILGRRIILRSAYAGCRGHATPAPAPA
jgi:hypothetical protein